MELKQNESWICTKDKSLVTYICLNLNCRFQRKICQKCITNHEKHEIHIVEVNEIIGSCQSSKQQTMNLLIQQSAPLQQVYQNIRDLDKIKSQVMLTINQLKQQYLSSLDINEDLFNPNPIFDSIESCSKSDESIEKYINRFVQYHQMLTKDNQIQNLDISSIQKCLDNLKRQVDQFDNIIKEKKKLVIVSATKPQDKIINQPQDLEQYNMDTKRGNQEQQNSKKPNCQNQNQVINNIKIVQLEKIPLQLNAQEEDVHSKLDKIIKSKNLYFELLQPLLKQKIDFGSLSKKINNSETYRLEFDGCSKGNPGLSGAGFLISTQNKESTLINEFAINVGNKTSNQSEYLAIIYGFYVALKIGVQKIFVQGDSLLIINQMLGKYQVKSENISNYNELCKSMKQLFSSCSFNHVYRNLNTRADYLSNLALEPQN